MEKWNKKIRGGGKEGRKEEDKRGQSAGTERRSGEESDVNYMHMQVSPDSGKVKFLGSLISAHCHTCKCWFNQALWKDVKEKKKRNVGHLKIRCLLVCVCVHLVKGDFTYLRTQQELD